MMVKINKASNIPYYLQLKNQFKELILSETYKPDTKLPPTRQLAEKLKINRNTVLTAYEELEADGLVHSHVGQGTFVSDMSEYLKERERDVQRKFNWTNSFSAELDESALSSLVQLYRSCISKAKVSFGGAHPDDILYPIELVKRCFNSVLREEGSEILRYGPIEGYYPLREFMTKWIKNKGIETSPENIFITSGSQQALEIASRILIEAGNYVITEEPTYTGALSIFNTLRARIIGVPMEKDGLNLDVLEDALKKYNPKFIYTIPNFQNPTGITMSINKRKRLILLAEKYNVPIIEDDVSGDLRFEGEDLLALKALDRTDQVIYVSSLSKELIPGFRVGWAVLNESVRDRFIALKQVEDLTTNTISQAILYKFCSRGYLKTHLRKVRRIYKERRDTIIKSIKKYLPKNIDLLKPQGGLLVWIRFAPEVDLTPVFEACVKNGVIFSLGSLFYDSTDGKNELRLSYAASSPKKIEEGIKILGEIISETIGKKESEAEELEMLPIL
ncbi:MAG: aminotransferase class I/II-fold pyridoxal phosphate-dependent enzyme [Candidatus Aminicenantes bacterium]|nr:aminotransferase class I/II-fold pyridoxal phosphate-dependent enzyme [Candidatus Aminicenantes bacterium]